MLVKGPPGTPLRREIGYIGIEYKVWLNDFIPTKEMGVITYPYPILRCIVVVKETPGAPFTNMI